MERPLWNARPASPSAGAPFSARATHKAPKPRHKHRNTDGWQQVREFCQYIRDDHPIGSSAAATIIQNMAMGAVQDTLADDRLYADRVAPDRVAPDRLAPDRIAPDRLSRLRIAVL